MIDEQSFRETMPAFADTAQYPSFQFNFYLNLGKKLLREERWEDMLDYGLTLFIAHYLTLYRRTMNAASIGGDAGKIIGNETSKAVDSVSKSMDVSGVLIAEAGHWNQTTFGVQFYQLMMMAGAGGIQL
ncbi:DUF4054 domain-containing protein [Acinetobacter nosocomialis]|uniref:DUF4054 domain-containing protein n=1 Tax=Acinetobacter nosocomialis TaxID=106654 RepID=UPI0009E11FA7|nr:DUF4054 domain-containing protein [Acinetobacter nosocomialis]ARG16064.1 hypothetical protein B7L44_05340 [Acinetobacter nosocomialis]MBP1470615.1 DUF4054 domain-containing protein [Acinetobacter nosocomialis]MCE5998372.1 DUF4054 domain-containing protein [Acinetobacter nosocomialis]